MMRALLTRAGSAAWAAGGILALAYVGWNDLAQHQDVASSPAPEAASGKAGEPASGSSATHAANADARQASCGRIRIGWTAWADAEFVTRLAAKLLQAELNCTPQLLMTDIGLQYRGVASGELDLMLMAWLPATHRAYYEKVAPSVENLGPLYTGARLGWVVPDYVPEQELGSIEDLHNPSVHERLRGRIQGIDPGSGLMQVSERAMTQYGLTDYRLMAGSGAAMTAALERAYRLQRWIVVTSWSPHWMFVRWKLRYLRDPKHVLSDDERIHALARRGFSHDYPRPVVDFISRMFIPLDELEDALLFASDHSVQAAVDHYLQTHPARVRYWTHGTL